MIFQPFVIAATGGITVLILLVRLLVILFVVQIGFALTGSWTKGFLTGIGLAVFLLLVHGWKLLLRAAERRNSGWLGVLQALGRFAEAVTCAAVGAFLYHIWLQDPSAAYHGLATGAVALLMTLVRSSRKADQGAAAA